MPNATRNATTTQGQTETSPENKSPSKILNIVVQIVLAIIVIIVLYIITLIVLNVDTIVQTSSTTVKPQEKTKIIDGYATSSMLSNRNFNTISPRAENFKKIGRSINTMGGAQFTYQFWIKIEDADDSHFKNLILLLKGDKRKYKMGYYANIAGSTTGKRLAKTIEADQLICAPMIRFNSSYRDFTVRINTAKHPRVDIPITMNKTPGIGRQNLLSLMALNSWYLLTFVFFDNFSIPQSTEDGIKFIFYVNDIPYVEENASTKLELKNNSIKQNDGDLFILPNNTNNANFMKIANINYYNYALNASQVESVYKQGAPTYGASEINQKQNMPTYISAYNKIDVFNM